MGPKYASMRKKMEKEFEQMKQPCVEVNMPDEAIEEMHRIMLDEVNNDRKYYKHNAPLDIVASSENEKSDESWSPYYKQHLEQFSVCQPEISEWGRDAWIEDLDTPEIIVWAKGLSETDMEILTYLMVERLQKQEIAAILGYSPSTISRHLKRMEKELKKILPQG